MAWGVASRSGMFARGIVLASTLLSSSAKTDPALHERPPLSAVMFGSLDAGAGKIHGAFGMKYAIGGDGLDASGFRLSLVSGASTEPARRRPTQGSLYRSDVGALLGYEWRIHDSFVTVSVGPDLETAYLTWRAWRAIGQRIGPRIQLDMWAAPDRNSLIQVNAYAVAAGSGRSGARVAAGWRMAQQLYLGPEVELYRERDYFKVRLGMHLTGLEFFGITWRLSAGAQKSRDDRNEIYATLGFHWKR